jgi:ABC-type nitrate/sulfonate/bicarbonate transport system substrate-binding protein
VRALQRCVLRSLFFASALWFFAAPLRAEEIAISYPGLSGDSASLWMAGEGGFFKENGVDAKLVYMEGGRLSIQSLLSGHTQFMAGDAVSALSAVASGADIVLLGSAKNVLPYVFGVTKQVRRIQDLKGKVVGISQIGGRAGEIARMVIKNNGLDPDKDVIYLAVGGTMSRLAALATGKVQAAPISKGRGCRGAGEGAANHRGRTHSSDHRCALDHA